MSVRMFTGYSDSSWISKMGITVYFQNTKWTGLIRDIVPTVAAFTGSPAGFMLRPSCETFAVDWTGRYIYLFWIERKLTNCLFCCCCVVFCFFFFFWGGGDNAACKNAQ